MQTLRSNFWVLHGPTSVFRVDAAIGGWEEIERRVRRSRGAVVAGLVGGSVLALGSKRDVERAFGSATEAPLQTESELLPILRDALVQSLARAPLRSLKVRRRWFIVDDATRTVVTLRGRRIVYFSCVEVRLDRRNDDLLLVLEPERHLPVQLQPPGFTRQDVAAAKRELLGARSDREYETELTHWQAKLGVVTSSATQLGFGFSVDAGPVVVSASFRAAIVESASDVIHVGLGYFVHSAAHREKASLTACAAVFDGAGRALGHQLVKPAAAEVNLTRPTLPLADARALATKVRASLPASTKRVVLCKRGSFTRDELDGFASLGDLAVDIVSLDEESACRFVPIDDETIARGTTIVFDPSTLVLYESRRPMRARRQVGSSPLETLANDVLTIVHRGHAAAAIDIAAR